MKTLLDLEIAKVDEYLYQFTKTKVWDSGVRLAETEAYLKGLEKAKRLVNKQKKLESINYLKKGEGVR